MLLKKNSTIVKTPTKRVNWCGHNELNIITVVRKSISIRPRREITEQSGNAIERTADAGQTSALFFHTAGIKTAHPRSTKLNTTKAVRVSSQYSFTTA